MVHNNSVFCFLLTFFWSYWHLINWVSVILQTEKELKYSVKNVQETRAGISQNKPNMVNKYIKNCSTLLLINQVMMTWDTILNPFSWKICMCIKSDKAKCWRGFGSTESSVHCWRECKLAQSLWKIICHYFMKMNIHMPFFIPRYILKRNFCVSILKDMLKNVYSSTKAKT